MLLDAIKVHGEGGWVNPFMVAGFTRVYPFWPCNIAAGLGQRRKTK